MTMSVFEYVVNRQSYDVKLSKQTVTSLTSLKIPLLLKPSNIKIKSDKVFASKWLDERRVICGTKCNKLLVLDVVTKERLSIPMLEGSRHTTYPSVSAGVHDIAINQSRSLLATSGENPNHLAVYRLPTFDPVCVGECHSDWVFSTEWINNSLLATGSRDGTISIWNVDDQRTYNVTGKLSSITSRGEIDKTQPPCVAARTSLTGVLESDRIRAMAYNSNTECLAALSPNALLHMWDVVTETDLSSIPLPHFQENVCLALHKEKGIYAIGSQSHVSFVDANTFQLIKDIKTNDIGAGVRSVSFQDSLVTIGTGHGSVIFFDVNASKFLEKKKGSEYSLRSGKGWLRFDSTFYEFFTEQDADCFKNAIYTHCYDPTATKLFTAGGPLALVLHGNYAAVWE